MIKLRWHRLPLFQIILRVHVTETDIYNSPCPATSCGCVQKLSVLTGLRRRMDSRAAAGRGLRMENWFDPGLIVKCDLYFVIQDDGLLMMRWREMCCTCTKITHSNFPFELHLFRHQILQIQTTSHCEKSLWKIKHWIITLDSSQWDLVSFTFRLQLSGYIFIKEETGSGQACEKFYAYNLKAWIAYSTKMRRKTI